MMRELSDLLRPQAKGYSLPVVGAILRNYGIILAFLLFFVVLSFSTPAFLTPRNLHNIVD
ncbi:MAG: hypothetical protein ACOZCF_11700 [Bacillota bacterium]